MKLSHFDQHKVQAPSFFFYTDVLLSHAIKYSHILNAIKLHGLTTCSHLKKKGRLHLRMNVYNNKVIKEC